jgi:hypothetical protein
MASDILALEGRVNTVNEQWGNVLQWPMERLLICRPTANLWAGLVEVGGFVEHPDIELTQDQRDRLEMMGEDNIRLHDLDDPVRPKLQR